MRKVGLLLVPVTGLMLLGGSAIATPSDTELTQVLWGAGAVADSTGAQNAGQPATDPDKMVCKTMPPATGSRIGTRRECHTQGEWDQIARQDQSALSRAQGMGYQTNQTPGH